MTRPALVHYAIRGDTATVQHVRVVQLRLCRRLPHPWYGSGVIPPRAHSLEDASLFVLADGQDMTRLEYRLGHVRDLAIHRRGNPSSPGKIDPKRL